MAGNRVPKVREEDWISVQKAMRRLNAAASGDTNVTYRVVNVNTTIQGEGAGGAELKNFYIEIVDDAAARLALEWFLARMCFQRDEGTLWLATTL